MGATGGNPRSMSPSARTPTRSLEVLIEEVTFDDVKQSEESILVQCTQYDRLMFYVDITAAGPADASIEMQVYLQAYDGVSWYYVNEAPVDAWEYDHADVVSSVRPRPRLIKECLSWEVSADQVRIAVVSSETTAVKTFTLSIKVQAMP